MIRAYSLVMKMPCALPASILIFLSLASLAQAISFPALEESTEAPELQKILHKHWEAMGGMRNWSKVESIRLKGTIERDGQVVDICIVKKRPNQIRATVTLPLPGKDDETLQVIRAHDGQTAWTATRLAGGHEMNQEELPPEAAAELLADAGVLPPLLKLWREGAELELLDPQTINGEAFMIIQTANESTGSLQTFYVSAESHRLLRADSHHPEHGTTTTTYSDYRNHSGIYLPGCNVINSRHTGHSVITTKSTEIGIGIYDKYFQAVSLTEAAPY